MHDIIDDALQKLYWACRNNQGFPGVIPDESNGAVSTDAILRGLGLTSPPVENVGAAESQSEAALDGIEPSPERWYQPPDVQSDNLSRVSSSVPGATPIPHKIERRNTDMMDGLVSSGAYQSKPDKKGQRPAATKTKTMPPSLGRRFRGSMDGMEGSDGLDGADDVEGGVDGDDDVDGTDGTECADGLDGVNEVHDTEGLSPFGGMNTMDLMNFPTSGYFGANQIGFAMGPQMSDHERDRMMQFSMTQRGGGYGDLHHAHVMSNQQSWTAQQPRMDGGTLAWPGNLASMYKNMRPDGCGLIDPRRQQ
jgi:hypothetical protein